MRRLAPAILLAGQLQQDGLLASGMGWELGDEARRAAEQELLGEAIARLRARADAVAMAMAAPAAAPEVAAEAGMEVVRVAVQAEALLGQGR